MSAESEQLFDGAASVAHALADPDQPAATFAALDAALGRSVGHKLFTVLLLNRAGGYSQRVYTNQPEAYPVGGRKPIPTNAWGRLVLDERQPYIGNSYEDIRAVFPDHETIRSLGCESVLNQPVVHAGRTLGTINLLHQAGWYEARHLTIVATMAAFAIPALLEAAGSATV